MEKSENTDRISNLPDHLISYIISFLPTKSAVATSSLSTRWKYLWTSITKLDFALGNNGLYKKPLTDEKRKFASFVNRVLRGLNNPSTILNFRLEYYPKRVRIDLSHLNSWISEASELTSQQIYLALKGHLLPILRLNDINFCNLVFLKLRGDVHFCVPAKASVCFLCLRTLDLDGITSVIASDSSVSFPSVKSMNLIHIKLASDDSVNKILSNCPILEWLYFQRDDHDNLSCLRICIPSLKRLRLVLLSEPPCEVEINTPALEYLYLNDVLLSKYLPMENFSSLRQAEMRLSKVKEDDVEGCTSLCKLIGRLSNVKFLSGSNDFLKVIRIAPTNISIRFYSLVRLELLEHYCTDFAVGIINLLERMENLEHFVVKGLFCNCCEQSQSQWTEPLNVPQCLLSRLTTVFFDFECDPDAECHESLEFLRYLLKNGEILQLLNISSRPFELPEFEMLRKKISMFPRASKTCQVAFKSRVQ